MIPSPQVVIDVDQKGARETAAELAKVNAALDSIDRAGAKAAQSTAKLTAAQEQQQRQSKSVIGTLGDLGERLDKDLEQRYGRVFKVTDRVNGILGQFGTVATLAGLAITGVTAAIAHFTKASDTGAKGANIFAKSIQQIGDQARQAAADIDAVNLAAQGLANGRFDFSAAEQVTLQALARDEKARLKTAGDYNAQLLEIERNMRRGYGISEKDLALAQARLDSELAELDTIRAKRQEILKAAADRTRVAAAPAPRTQAAATAAGPDGIEFDEGALGRLQIANAYRERQNQILAEQREQILQLGEALAGPFVQAGQKATAALGQMFDMQQAATTMGYDLAQSLLAQGQSFASTALMAAVYGGSVEDAVNQEATLRFYQALLGVPFAAAQLGLATFLNPAAVPGAQMALANMTLLAALSGTVAAATGGLGAAGGAGGGAAAAPQGFAPATESDFGRDREPTRTEISVNFVAAGQPTRDDAYTVAMSFRDLFELAGLAPPGGRA